MESEDILSQKRDFLIDCNETVFDVYVPVPVPYYKNISIFSSYISQHLRWNVVKSRYIYEIVTVQLSIHIVSCRTSFFSAVGRAHSNIVVHKFTTIFKSLGETKDALDTLVEWNKSTTCTLKEFNWIKYAATIK